MPASSEFVALCRSQVALLTQGLGAALCAVYLTEELVEGAEAKLIPVILYPETAVMWEANQALVVLPELTAASSTPAQLPSEVDREAQNTSVDVPQHDPRDSSLWQQSQIFLPLMHEDVMMGLLVTGREDRPWNEQERLQIEQIAHTLTFACILDRRRAWYEQRLTQVRRRQAQQHNILHDLLHQFRNPLTALRTFGKLLKRRLLAGDANFEVASSIVRETDRLQELLQQFDAGVEWNESDLAPISLTATLLEEEAAHDTFARQQTTLPLMLPAASGTRLALTLESCSVASVLEPLLISARALAQERNLNLTANIPPDLPPVQANPKALREVLSNLLDNAVKYTPTGGQIDIEVGFERHSPRTIYQGIAISDTGVGIPAPDLEHIFERHYRGVQALSDIPGTGLGLAIAKEIVETMQGEIEVFSPASKPWATDGTSIGSTTNALGIGTTFIVWLPTQNS